MEALPVYGLATAVGGVGMGLFTAIAGGLKSLNHKQILDKKFPLVSEEFMRDAEKLIAEAAIPEAQLAETSDVEKQTKYEALIQQLEDLIAPPADDEDEDEE